MVDDIENPAARRLRVRRGRSGGFSSGAGRSTEARGMRAHQEPEDEVDYLVDPHEVAEGVRSMPEGVPAAVPGRADDPRRRMQEVSMSGSASYSKEYRMAILHRLLMRKIPLDQIARQLGVSISTVEKDRAQLKKALREKARELNIDEMIGNQQEIYDEVAAIALRTATNTDTPTAMQLAALRTTLAAHADKTRFYHAAGVFDAMRFRKAEDGSGQSDIQLLMQRTSELLSRTMGDDEGFGDFEDHEEVIDL